jgi:hypothetical protein
MQTRVPPGRIRCIAPLSAEVELLRQRIAALAGDLARLDVTIERLGQERAWGMTRGILDILRRAGHHWDCEC